MNLIVASRADLSVDYTLYDDPVTFTLPATFVSSGVNIQFTETYEISKTQFEVNNTRLLQTSIITDDGSGNFVLGEQEIT